MAIARRLQKMLASTDTIRYAFYKFLCIYRSEDKDHYCWCEPQRTPWMRQGINMNHAWSHDDRLRYYRCFPYSVGWSCCFLLRLLSPIYFVVPQHIRRQQHKSEFKLCD